MSADEATRLRAALIEIASLEYRECDEAKDDAALCGGAAEAVRLARAALEGKAPTETNGLPVDPKAQRCPRCGREPRFLRVQYTLGFERQRPDATAVKWNCPCGCSWLTPVDDKAERP